MLIKRHSSFFFDRLSGVVCLFRALTDLPIGFLSTSSPSVLNPTGPGLRARAREGAGGMVPDERHFLNALHDIVDRGETAADELLAQYNSDWDGDVTRVFAEHSY